MLGPLPPPASKTPCTREVSKHQSLSSHASNLAFVCILVTVLCFVNAKRSSRRWQPELRRRRSNPCLTRCFISSDSEQDHQPGAAMPCRRGWRAVRGWQACGAAVWCPRASRLKRRRAYNQSRGSTRQHYRRFWAAAHEEPPPQPLRSCGPSVHSARGPMPSMCWTACVARLLTVAVQKRYALCRPPPAPVVGRAPRWEERWAESAADHPRQHAMLAVARIDGCNLSMLSWLPLSHLAPIHCLPNGATAADKLACIS
jgi:hypothetical protein